MLLIELGSLWYVGNKHIEYVQCNYINNYVYPQLVTNDKNTQVILKQKLDLEKYGKCAIYWWSKSKQYDILGIPDNIRLRGYCANFNVFC